MRWKGKKIIVLGERDGVPSESIVACLRGIGADVVFESTECYV